MTGIVFTGMDVSRPYATAITGLEGPALLVLSTTTRPLTGREVVRLAPEGSQYGIQKALDRLVKQGLVYRQEAGRAALYTLNRDHIAAAAVEELVSLRARLLARLSDRLASWQIPPVHSSLFGSAARGSGNADSDIDLLLVRPRSVSADDPTWRSQVSSLAEDVRAWTGNDAGIVETDAPGLRAAEPGLRVELESDAVQLVGQRLEQVISAS
jgi:predicted nucleotidyltransferase